MFIIQVVIECITGTGEDGYGAIDDFIFATKDECPQHPEDSVISEGNCDFQKDLCGEWVLPESPDQSFFNRTTGKELFDNNIEGPETDELDNGDGKT